MKSLNATGNSSNTWTSMSAVVFCLPYTHIFIPTCTAFCLCQIILLNNSALALGWVTGRVTNWPVKSPTTTVWTLKNCILLVTGLTWINFRRNNFRRDTFSTNCNSLSGQLSKITLTSRPWALQYGMQSQIKIILLCLFWKQLAS